MVCKDLEYLNDLKKINEIRDKDVVKYYSKKMYKLSDTIGDLTNYLPKTQRGKQYAESFRALTSKLRREWKIED